MVAGIKENDGLVMHKEGAWHGMGTVVEDAPTPREALTLANLEWGVEGRPIFTKDADGNDITLESHVANYRMDVPEEVGFLGLVSSKYRPIQNAHVADFCGALRDEGDVKIETAGSVGNGWRVWFLLKGASFEVANGDGIMPYILVSNGHDGGTTFRVTPTTVRAVCYNTLHCIIPVQDSGELLKSAMSIRHTVNVMERVEEAKAALKSYGQAIEETKNLADFLSKKDVTSDAVKEFFLECYTEDYGEIPINPQTKVEENRRNRATSAYNSFSKRFDDEREIARASWWNAANAYSGLVQHDQKARGKTDEERISKRIDSNLFGLNSERTHYSFRRAYRKALGLTTVAG